MNFEGAQWVIGLFITMAIAVGTALYRLGLRMSGQHKLIYDKIDEVKKDYVRRDDFDRHLDQQERQYEKIDAKLDKITSVLIDK